MLSPFLRLLSDIVGELAISDGGVPRLLSKKFKY